MLMSSETQLGSCSSGEVVSPSVATHGRASKFGLLRSTGDGRGKHNRLCDEVTEDEVSQPLSKVKKVRKLESSKLWREIAIKQTLRARLFCRVNADVGVSNK
jgi:hypothetical protein